MRKRTTFLLPSRAGVDPASIKVSDASLSFSQPHGTAEEERITLGLGELPEEIQVFLQDFHELHVRVASPQNYPAVFPTLARVPPGLHAFFTPRKLDTSTKLCPMLKLLLSEDVKCSDSSNSFSKPPILSERFASSSTYQFYHGPSDLQAIATTLHDKLCNEINTGTGTVNNVCSLLGATSDAAYVDYDFDAISHAVTITILWPARETNAAERTLLNPKHQDRLEVGILSPEEPKEPEELSLGGFLTIVGEDDHPSPTLFSFPARHHTLDETTYSANFQQPTGLHPKLDLTFPAQHLNPPKDSCALHAYWTLPSSLFIDRYQLSDPLFLSSQNLISLRAISGEQDLEAPNWAVNTWGSASLLELSVPAEPSATGNWTVTIPTHLRYLNATASPSGHAEVSIPWPVVFWACEAEEGLKMATNPFDRVNIGYDGLFGPKTMFYHVSPSLEVDVLVETLQVPVLDPASAKWVPFGTVVAVLLGFGWVCWQMVKGGKGPTVTEEKKGK